MHRDRQAAAQAVFSRFFHHPALLGGVGLQEPVRPPVEGVGGAPGLVDDRVGEVAGTPDIGFDPCPGIAGEDLGGAGGWGPGPGKYG